MSVRLVDNKLQSADCCPHLLSAPQPSPLEQSLREEAGKVEETRKLLAAVTAKGATWAQSMAEASSAAEGVSRAVAVLAGYEQDAGYAPHLARAQSTLAEGMAKVCWTRGWKDHSSFAHRACFDVPSKSSVAGSRSAGVLLFSKARICRHQSQATQLE